MKQFYPRVALLTIAVPLIFTFNLQAQQGFGEPVRGLKLFEQTSFRAAPLSNEQLLATEIPLGSQNVFVAKTTTVDDIGYTHEKYQQYYNGYKVEFGETTIHRQKGALRSLSYSTFNVEGLSNSTSLSVQQAFERATAFVGASKYVWEDVEEAQFHSYERPKGELVVFPNITDNNDNAVMAYKFDVYAVEPLYRSEIYVNANTGTILFENKIIHHADLIASGPSLYNGIVSFTANNDSGNHVLRQIQNRNGINTYNMNSGTDYDTATDFSSASNVFGQETTTGIQTHWGTEQTYNYFLEKHGRNSYDNNGAALNSYVSYRSGYANAFWNGAVMTYGDGDGITSGPWVAIDIVGHEISHAVTEYSANLIYSYESGALNESFSDIFGEMVENYALGSNNWLANHDIGLGGNSGAIRSMANPNQFSHPDTYKGDYWVASAFDNGGVHFNSGVQNKWFYLLANGESGVNDNGDSYMVEAIGLEKAAAIAYRNLTVYLSRFSQFNDARLGAIQAARDLYGVDSLEEIAVTNAWYAVGVGEKYQICDENFENEDDSVVLGTPTFVSGLDFIAGTTTDTNDSYCALQVSNSDTSEPWARLSIPIDLEQNGLVAGDILVIGIDGRGEDGYARVELNQNNVPNTSLFFKSFGVEWSRAENEVIVPEGVNTLDLWLFSNYKAQTGSTSVYDNLSVKKVDYTADFVTTWKTDNQGSSNDNQLTIPYSGAGAYSIDWGDGTVDRNVSTTMTHTYEAVGAYQVRISERFDQIGHGFSKDRNKLVSIDQWGKNRWTSLSYAFANCKNVRILATDIPDLSIVTSLSGLFFEADLINYDISNWETSGITDMSSMFRGANSFDQDLSNLDISSVRNFDYALSFSGLSSENYDKILTSWGNREGLSSNVAFGAEGITFCEGREARQRLIDTYNWNINDAGIACPNSIPFLSTWQIGIQGGQNNEKLTIPYPGSGTYTIDWGDGTSNSDIRSIITHSYAAAGTYQVSISGTYPRITFGDSEHRAKLVSVDQWGDTKWSSTSRAFIDCPNVQILAADTPDLSFVYSTAYMFYNANKINVDINDWATGNVRDMSYMFYGATDFDQDLSNLDIGSVTSMIGMFSNSGLSSTNYDGMLISWSELEGLNSRVSVGADGINYCEGAAARKKLIDTYSWYFSDAGLACSSTIPFMTSWKTDNPGSSNDNQITIPYPGSGNYSIDWGDGATTTDVSETMTHTYNAIGTYQIRILGTYPRITFGNSSDSNKLVSVDQWGDMQWPTMENAFAGCSNVRIVAEDVPDLSFTTSLRYMFSNADSMNEDISGWDVSSIITMYAMFQNADNFNQDISSWDTGKVTDMSYVFNQADRFDQDLSNLDISSVTSLRDMFSYSGLSNENYDSMLISWSELEGLNNYVSLGALGINYCEGSEARQALIDNYNWYINDAGLECSSLPFITVWKTNNPGSSDDNQILFPLFTDGNGSYQVDWGDGAMSTGEVELAGHTYETPGTYTVTVTGYFPRISFMDQLDKLKLIEVKQWGNNSWEDVNSAFSGCANMQVTATDTPNLSRVTSLFNMFYDCSSLEDNPSFNEWDVSSITNMRGLFYQSSFDSNIADWDMSNVEVTTEMFSLSPFNQDVTNWNVSKVVYMENMFSYTPFNQDISGWDVSRVEQMSSMFFEAVSFDQDLGDWNVSQVKRMNFILGNAGLSTENYDSTLLGWASLPSVQMNVDFNAGNSTYCFGEEARQELVDTFGWNILDAGRGCQGDECVDYLANEDPGIILAAGTFAAGGDLAIATSIDTNGSPCALEVINNDVNQPWARYRIAINLEEQGISAGDELFFGIDGNSSRGTARFELVQDNRPNSWIVSNTFGDGWSRYEQTVTVPECITTLDIWLFSNFASDTSGRGIYDNLTVVNLSVVPELPTVNNVNMVVGIEPGLPLDDGKILVDGANIDPLNDAGGFAYDFRANTSANTQSVAFQLTGDVTKERVDSTVPFFLYGEDSFFNRENLPEGSYTLSLTPYDCPDGTGNAGPTETINFTVRVIGQEECPDDLLNEHPDMVLPAGTFTAGGDRAIGTSTSTNGSNCAIEVINDDSNQPWARYQIAIDLVAQGVSAGDRLFIGIDGSSARGIARFELVQDNRPNSWLASRTFNIGWSHYEQTVTVPEDITTLDIWLFSNFGSDAAGVGIYDNLKVINLSAQPELPKIENVNMVIGIPGEPISDGKVLVEGGNIDPINDAGGTNFDLRANSDALTQSVVFELTGDSIKNMTDSAAPFYLFGEDTIFEGANLPEGNYQLQVTPYEGPDASGNAGPTMTINFTVRIIGQEECPDDLPNENPDIVLPVGTFTAGGDHAIGTSNTTNGSDCALEVFNDDLNQPWARYQIAIDLTAQGISAGDELFIGIDGNSSRGTARFELVQDSRPNSWIISKNFDDRWSRYEQTVTVPEDITTLDIWLFSNFGSDAPGVGIYDNLTVINLSANRHNVKQSDAEETARLNIYPNPAQRIANIAFEPPTTIRLLSVYDMVGRLVANAKVDEVAKEQGYGLDVHGLPVGAYVIIATNNKGQQFREQLLIKR